MREGSATRQELKFVSFDAPNADMNANDYNGTFPVGINNEGAVTGYYVDANNVYHGFLRSHDGHFTTFEATGADTTPNSYNGTTPSVINDLGEITGNYADVHGNVHGFLRGSTGTFKTLDIPGGTGTYPLAMNLQGAVVGYYTDANNVIRAFVRTPDGKFKTWTGPGACVIDPSQGCYGSGASNINDLGFVVGGYEDNGGNFVHHSFFRDLAGKLQIFDVPGAGTGSYQGTGCPGCALGFNLWGTVAGTYIDSNGVQHGFIRTPDSKITTFDAPGAGNSSYQGTGCSSDCPTILNNWGVITGNYIDSNYVLHGYLRSAKGDIVTVDPSGSTFTWSSGLNDLGVMTGYYLDANNVFHGFLAFRN
ncbi:MAG TPA: hypothetical protein VMU28_04905 [Terriglobales bacterium]|nr:hypothetical protein [Terriglobales bacterium]